MPASNNQLPRVRIRTFRHGLGDCHLVTFAKPDGMPFHILIDCGIVNRTGDPAKDPKLIMQGVAKKIQAETGGNIDLVIATHQHWDHISGFKYAADTFKDMKFKRLWLSWTEDPSKPLGKQIHDELLKKLTAVRAAASRLAATASSDPKAEKPEALKLIEGVLGFYGPGAKGEDTQVILDALQARKETETEYIETGIFFPMPEIPGVRVYVLGPPKTPADLKVTNPRKSKKEGYELAASANGFVAALSGADGSPFEARHARKESEIRKDKAFATYFEANNEWRKIDKTWLAEAESLALYLSDYTNNTSLALAFEFIDTKEVLLFPGDAQIGSWLTWPRLVWNVLDAGGGTREVKVRNLFEKTVFYKVSHHASHNGTLSGLGEGRIGFEQMTDRDLVCVVPVDRKMSEGMGWDRTLPWEPLLKRMREATRGRLILTDQNEPQPDPATAPLLSPTERERFSKRVKIEKDWVDFSL